MNTAASYPGPARAWVDEGPAIYFDGCRDPTGVQNVYAEVYYGGTTASGYPVLPSPTSPPFTAMTDLASNWSWKFGTPPTFPIYGNVMPTTHVVYVSHP